MWDETPGLRNKVDALEAALKAVNKTLETLRTESLSLIGMTDEMAFDYQREEPALSQRLFQACVGQRQSHSLIDKYVFEARQLIHQNINQGE